MLIVKPYGRSEVAHGEDKTLRRQLRLKPDDSGPHALPKFAREHPELVVAQWISVIDKIAAKPRANSRPTSEQRKLRDTLGGAAWSILEKRLPPERVVELGKLWRRKIHPYSDRDDDRALGREKGRWYSRFAGETAASDIGAAEAAEIAGKIEEHLYKTEYRINGGRPHKQKGRIVARAASIAGNVITPISGLPEIGWTDADIERYRAAEDVAAIILKAAKTLEAAGRRVGHAVAASVLHEHYARLFPGTDGLPLSVAAVREGAPGLFALHTAVRETYKRILKNHGKDRREHGEYGKKRRRVSTLLPGDMDALIRLAGAMERNRKLNALVRLGKLLHYESGSRPNATEGTRDEPLQAVDRWPCDGELENGHYRTSAGQAEIKRNEAFVRIWRGAVAFAQRTLTDWADPDRDIDRDILVNASIKRATGDGFRDDEFNARLRLLFGSRSRLFDGTDQRAVLCLALRGWAGLRNGSFHFKGRGGFARALRAGVTGAEITMPEAVRKLLVTDASERRARLIALLRAANVEYYLSQSRLAALLGAVTASMPASSPLPRFRRVLDRAEKAWRIPQFTLRLPGPENRRSMEANPGLLARYVSLKMLYERAFPAWFGERDAGALNSWIERAADRATKAARTINQDPDAAARSAGLVQLADGEAIADFMDRLAGLTASEYRVQRDYASDPDAARKQAKHLEDLRCDVVAQAFEAYLLESGFDWALEALKDGSLPDEVTGDLDEVSLPVEADLATDLDEDWPVLLYFLLHLIPVEAAAGLRHQLRKLSVLEPVASTDVTVVEWLLNLYLDMHDAKFEGGEGVFGAEPLSRLFEAEADFGRVCPESPGNGVDRHVPWRGLREMLRFGAKEHRLMGIFGNYPIRFADVQELECLEGEHTDGTLSPIAAAHARREELHAKWAGGKKEFCHVDKEAYRESLNTVVRHRHLAAHVRLENHARLHRLAVAVLARLADFAGLWERDLYFATLALIRLEKRKPEEVFKSKGLDRLSEGRIVNAVRDLKKNEDGSESNISKELQKLFGEGFLSDRGIVSVRRDLLHFNMLERKANEPFDLTAAVNDARRLMAYDRKLKNAASRSVIELLARNGLELAWEMRDHHLAAATVKSRQAVHLGDRTITEELHGQTFVTMAAALFGGSALSSVRRAGGKKRSKSGDAQRTGPQTPERRQPRTTVLPPPGQRMHAVLIGEKTKRGAWKAEIDLGGERVVGDIFNSGEVPLEAEPGLEVDLVVRVANPKNASFLWPSPDVEARHERVVARRHPERRTGRRR